jgi:hypothetical protein
MTPKEKARQLVNHFVIEIDYDSVSNVAWKNPMDEKENIRTMKDAKRYSLITVSEVIKVIPKYVYGQGEKALTEDFKFWQVVIHEIAKL